jgi:hypothetical protein
LLRIAGYLRAWGAPRGRWPLSGQPVRVGCSPGRGRWSVAPPLHHLQQPRVKPREPARLRQPRLAVQNIISKLSPLSPSLPFAIIFESKISLFSIVMYKFHILQTNLQYAILFWDRGRRQRARIDSWRYINIVITMSRIA